MPAPSSTPSPSRPGRRRSTSPCSRSAVTIFDLAQRIRRLTGADVEIRFEPHRSPDVEIRIPDVDKARRLLGFEARVELDEGLARTIAWYRTRKPAPA